MAMDPLYTEALKELDQVKAERDKFRKAEEMQIALRVKMEGERGALRNLVDQFKAATIKASMNGFGQDDVHHDDSWIDELDHALTRTQHHDAKRQQAETWQAASSNQDNCTLECGAYGTYCKCAAEGNQ